MYLSSIFILVMVAISQMKEITRFEMCALEALRRNSGTTTLYVQIGDYDMFNILRKINTTILVGDKNNNYFKPVHIHSVFLCGKGRMPNNGFYFSYATVDRLSLIVAYYGSYKELLYFLGSISRKYTTVVVITNSLEIFSFRPTIGGYYSSITLQYLGDCSNLHKIQFGDVLGNITDRIIRVSARIRLPYVDNKSYEDNQGFEVAILKLLVDKLKLKIEFVPIDQYSLYTFTDIRVNPISFTSRNTYFLQDEAALLVPLVEPKQTWKNLLLIYDIETWCALLLSIALVSCAWFLLHQNKGGCSACLFTIAVLISSVPKQPRHRRFLFILWAMASMIIINAYTGLLVSFMFKPILSRQISSIAELNSLGWHILDTSGLSSLAQLLSESHEWCNYDSIECYNQLGKGKIAYGGLTRQTKYYMKQTGIIYTHKVITSNIQRTFSVTMYTPHQSLVQQVLCYLFDAGLITHLDVYDAQLPTPVYSTAFKPIKVQHLILVLVMYFVCITLASVVFIVEKLLGQ